MPPKAGYCTPMLHVADVVRSIRFYEKLGFTLIDHEGTNPICWARVHCEGGALMFLRNEEEPMHPAKQAVLFYLYTPDLPALREHLLAQGVEVSAISHPPHMQSGEVCLRDPDGYFIQIGHWGEKEHAEWEKNRKPML